MLSVKYRKMTRCTKCGAECYNLCYIGDFVVCVDCFFIACKKAERNR